MRIVAIVKRILQQIFRDKRTLALVLVAPLLILTLMYYLLNSGDDVQPRLGVVHIEQDLIEELESRKLQVIDYEQIFAEMIGEEQLDGLLQLKNNQFDLTLENSDPTKAKALLIQVSQAVASFIQKQSLFEIAMPDEPSIQIYYIYGDSETSFFDILSPILVGFFVFFFVFLISGIGLLRERTTGTLERLMSTPVRRGEVIIGYLAGYGIIAIIQTVIVVFYSINVLNITLEGLIWNVFLINILLALVALSLGILLSTFAASEFQMIQFIPIVIIPQIFFAGIIPLEGMANWLQVISRIMPIYYGADALKSVMYKGLGFFDIYGNLLALFTFAFIFIVLNIFALKKYRKL